MRIKGHEPHYTHLAFYDGGLAPQGTPSVLVKGGARFGGYNPKTGKVAPFRNIVASEARTEEYLDNLTAAVEAGLADPQTFFADFFADYVEVVAFASRVRALAGWVNERHYHALRQVLCGGDDDCATYAAIANRVHERYEELTLKASRRGRQKA
ncbi:MAG TPA: hypothetical protein VGE20_04170 [Ramlibacter sp.]